MKKDSARKISIITFLLMAVSIITAAILPARSSYSDNKSGRNGRLFYEDSYDGAITCIAIEYASIYTCHDTVSGGWDDPSRTTFFVENTSNDNCGWCNDNTTVNDEFTGLDAWCS